MTRAPTLDGLNVTTLRSVSQDRREHVTEAIRRRAERWSSTEAQTAEAVKLAIRQMRLGDSAGMAIAKASARLRAPA